MVKGVALAYLTLLPDAVREGVQVGHGTKAVDHKRHRLREVRARLLHDGRKLTRGAIGLVL